MNTPGSAGRDIPGRSVELLTLAMVFVHSMAMDSRNTFRAPSIHGKCSPFFSQITMPC